MNINELTNKLDVKKQIFQRKPLQKEGLILQIHNTIQTGQKQQKIRFIHASFDNSGHILAAGDQAGNIFLLDFTEEKFWVLAIPTQNSTYSIITFSNYNPNELLFGVNTGKVLILNIHTRETKGELIWHREPVTGISFSTDFMCITCSQNAAVLWDLRSNNKIQVLNIEAKYQLKHVLFMPVTNNILACFEDDTVLIWKCGSFEVLKQIMPATWNKRSLKSITFTKNGRAMIFSGYSRELTIFTLDTWSVLNVVILPEYIQAVKKITFIPQLFDGGSNKVLGILSSNGIVYFFNIEENAVVNKICLEEEVIKFDCSTDGKNIACISRSGDVNIYKVGYYLPLNGSKDKKRSSDFSVGLKKSTSSLLSLIQKQIKDVLDVDKLKAILREFGVYPDAYRLKIWTQLLELPNNNQQYNNFINHVSHESFDDLEKSYPLENKGASKNLKKLLSNLVTWSPFFAKVTFLPIFVFPFVKIFQNDPVLCFEAICTIIVNFCQHWFEYFPLPPVNILAMVENLIGEHDPDLLEHFTQIKVTSKVYAWPLMEAAFSEVLINTDWCKLWDHILSNEPAFFIISIAAYSILQRNAVLAMNSREEFQFFYHNFNVLNIKRLISKSYAMLDNTSERNHPRRYLNTFEKIAIGAYPHFVDFPKIVIDFEYNELDLLRREREEMRKDEERILKEKEEEENKLVKLQMQEEESNRLKELEKVCRERIQDERERVKEQRERLVNLRQQLHREELNILNKSRERILQKNNKDRERALEKILGEVEYNRAAEELEVTKAESELVQHYSELLRHKIYIEDALYKDDQPLLTPTAEHQILKKQQQQLAAELEKVQKESQSKIHLKHLNITTGIAAMDNLIMKIEMELAQQMAERYKNITKGQANIKVLRLEAETKELELEVSKLLKLLAELKTKETEGKLSELHGSVTNRTQLLRPQESHFMRQQTSHEFKNKVSNISSFGQDFKKLKQLIQDSQDGYLARPPSLDSDVGISEELTVVELS